jgi:hypothetical protein
MRKIYTRSFIFLLAFLISFSGLAKAQLIITGLADGDLSGGLPKALELYAVTDIPDLAGFSVALYANGSATITNQYDFTGGSASAGDYILISTETPGFTSWFGFDSDIQNNVANFNGDDGVAVLYNGNVIDRFGVEGEDGTSKPWEYLDGWAYRVNGTGPDAVFIQDNWLVKKQALDGFISNFDAIEPFPIQTYSNTASADTDPPVWATGYPMAMDIVADGFTLAYKLDETSVVYYIVAETGATAPTVEEVKAGTGSAGSSVPAMGSSTADAGVEITTVIGNLTEGVTYDVFLVAEDDEATPNVQTSVASLMVTPATPPSVLYFADFETALDPFTAVNESGEKEWLASSGYAEINGYQSTSAEIDWLISPEIDLTNITSPSVSFKAAQRFGINDDTHNLKFYYSSDYDGNTANIATSTWVEVAFPLPAVDTWTDIGPIDMTALEGQIIYFAFVYNYPADDSYTRWRIDDAKVLGFAPAGSDATLSDLQIDSSTPADFDAAKTSYIIELPAGTTVVPTVTYTANDANATVVLTDATDLAGDAAARTTTVEVTAQDGNTVVNYSILFNPVVEVATLADLRAATDLSRKYKVTGEVTVTHTDSYRNKKYIQDATAAIEIDDSPGVITTSYNVGDVISGVTGTLEDYFDYRQLHPTEDPGASTKTNTIDPQLITISEFNTNFEDYEAEFIKIEGLTFADAGGTFGVGKNYVVSHGTDNTVVRTAFSAVSGSIPKMADVQGVALWHFSEAKIAPRNLSDIMVYSSDASLSDLTVDASTVTGFDAATLNYAVTLDAGTTTIPTVDYTIADNNATAVLTNATDLSGDEAARTTTVTVTAEDGTQQTYSIVFSIKVLSSDASLSDLAVNATTVTGFDAATLNYAVTLDVGTTTIPTVSYTIADNNATAVLTNATDLSGDEAARTTTVTVTAENGTQQTYSIIFSIDNTGFAEHKLHFSIYPVPADNFIKVSGLKTGTKLDIINITGVKVRTIVVTDQVMDLEISDLNKGVYLLRSDSNTQRFVKK